ncbi:MAG: hypothetical protein U0414_34485 [Polyangiaceae bacterium]
MTLDAEVSSFDEPKLEALIETMFHAATADGDFSAPERAEFVKNVASLTDKRLDSATLDALVKMIAAQTGSEGRPERLKAVSATLGSDRLRLVALELSIRIVAADGIVRTTERELLLDVATAFGIDNDKAADLVATTTASLAASREP